ncbi:MAG TPA: toll/interleukin-1 receptor domain-containing protein [Methylocella sp.]|nr:toll/interleukin-1 receptor domain-containing protein [Methylocella sp.]
MKVFVSYAREDAEFVDQLSGALNRRGFEVLVDRKDIPPLAVWKRELERMIRRADAAIFVLSPDWRTSKMCSWELDRVEDLGKRKAPIIARELDGEEPAILSDLQRVDFSGTSDFEAQAEALSTALNSDADWSRDHTSYQDKAVRWDELKRPDGYCLPAQESKAAKKWLHNRPPLGAAPTELQRKFIDRSTFINSWRYIMLQSVIICIHSAAAELGRHAGETREVFKYWIFLFFLFLAWFILGAIICIGWLLGLPYLRWLRSLAAFIKQLWAFVGTSLGLIQEQRSE